MKSKRIIKKASDFFRKTHDNNGTPNGESLEKPNDPHAISNVKCDVCGYTWVAVRPVGVKMLECPACKGFRNFENI